MNKIKEKRIEIGVISLVLGIVFLTGCVSLPPPVSEEPQERTKTFQASFEEVWAITLKIIKDFSGEKFPLVNIQKGDGRITTHKMQISQHEIYCGKPVSIFDAVEWVTLSIKLTKLGESSTEMRISSLIEQDYTARILAEIPSTGYFENYIFNRIEEVLKGNHYYSPGIRVSLGQTLLQLPYICEITKGSSAEKEGLKVGDEIYRINKKKIGILTPRSLFDLYRELEGKEGTSVKIEIYWVLKRSEMQKRKKGIPAELELGIIQKQKEKERFKEKLEFKVLRNVMIY